MAEKKGVAPPANLTGISRPGRGGVVVKPKNMKGTLTRLWQLTRGQRGGLGWILLLSALASGASILSPYADKPRASLRKARSHGFCAA